MSKALITKKLPPESGLEIPPPAIIRGNKGQSKTNPKIKTMNFILQAEEEPKEEVKEEAKDEEEGVE